MFTNLVGFFLSDIFRVYEGRIRILEEECLGYKENINNLKNKADEHGENVRNILIHVYVRE